MSKIKEYLKLIPRIKPIELIDGIVNEAKINRGTLPMEEVKVVMNRRDICRACPFNSINAVKLGIYKTDREDYHCSMCGCPISKRTASLSSNCGLEYYNHHNKDNPIELKWEKHTRILKPANFIIKRK